MLLNFLKIFSFFRPKKDSPTPTPTPKVTFPELLIKHATREIGVVETSRNQGPGIEKYWKATDYGVAGYYNREAYCAAFMCWLFMQAASEYKVIFSLPNKAGVIRWLEWAAQNTSVVTKLLPTHKVRRGDIILFDFNGPEAKGGHHIGIATKDEENGRICTIEGNTSISDQGSQSDGGGVHPKIRTKKYIVAVLRISV